MIERIEIAPNKEQQAIAYLQQLMSESDNQVAVTSIKQNQDSWVKVKNWLADY